MAAPDTVEEALYDATLEMIAEKNKKEAAGPLDYKRNKCIDLIRSSC